MFLAQCLSADHSCREVVTKLIGWRLLQNLKPCSANTGGYCTARDKLPEQVCHDLARSVGHQVDEEAPDSWRWLGRRVLPVDGSTLTMADTSDNQAEYPPTERPSQRLWLPDCPHCGDVFFDRRHSSRDDDRPVPGQTNRRKQSLPHLAAPIAQERCGAGRPLF